MIKKWSNKALTANNIATNVENSILFNVSALSYFVNHHQEQY